MECKQKDDNAENLWRVHDTIYDLTEFINKHPGGADWIKITKVIFEFKSPMINFSLLLSQKCNQHHHYFQGTDVTEAFEVHHLRYGIAENLLQDYRVRDAKQPRNFKFTFKEDGFYRTLRRRVAEKVKTLDQKRAQLTSKV